MNQEIQSLDNKINTLSSEFKNHRHTGLDSLNLDIPILPSDLGLTDDLLNAPLSTIALPTGGAVIDSEARNAINSLISRLQSLGLIS